MVQVAYDNSAADKCAMARALKQKEARAAGKKRRESNERQDAKRGTY